MNYLLVFVGGGLGCVLRYAISTGILRLYQGTFPLATLISNALSCAILVWIIGILSMENLDSKWVRSALIIGFCGGFSTFSTFGFETVQLIKIGNPWIAVANIVVSLSVCLLILYRLNR